MSQLEPKPIRSPSYPSMSLAEAIASVRKIEAVYRTNVVDRAQAARLIGYTSISGPSNMALASLAAFGLLERAGKGETRVTSRAKSLLYPDTAEEQDTAFRAAAMEPPLYCELAERFSGVAVPPEDGVVAYLNKQGFNPSAIRPAARAYLQTMRQLEERRGSESHGHTPPSAQTSLPPRSNPATREFGGATVGDLIQWESDGALRLERPLRVRLVTPDGQWVAVEGSETGIPMDQVIVEERGAVRPATAPTFAMAAPVDESAGGTEFKFKVGKDIVVQVRSTSELGVDAISRLLKLLEAQRDALLD